MRIGLIDVDGHNYPNLPLMKLSAWYKAQGDRVEWYEPLISGHLDRVYMSKVFSSSKEYEYNIDADEVIKGGSGYCITTENGVEVFDKSKDQELPQEIEHVYPDYSLYGITDRAFGFMSRGCPRGCSFCHVAAKEGRRSYKVADLEEFWNGQKYIELLDPNTLACAEWANILEQLARSGARVEFNQGVDVRMMDEARADALSEIKLDRVHFAWDRYEDKDLIIPKLELFAKKSKINPRQRVVYVLCHYDTTIEQDLDRIYTIRDLNYVPYVMLYDKASIPRGSRYKKLQRWVNARNCFYSCKTFEEYAP